MRISVITVSFNAASTIAETLHSVAEQSHADVEHIVVDGASTDGTPELVRREGKRVAELISEPDRGLYDGMNKGVARATGDMIAFLNADDIYAHPHVLSRVAEIMAATPTLDACYADLVFVARDDTSRAVRVLHSRKYQPGLFERGWMPPHPTLFVRRQVFERMGDFDIAYPRQADFDLALRFFVHGGLRARYAPEYWVRMRAGGISNGSVRGVWLGNLEAVAICKKNGLQVPPWFMLTKIGSRLVQFMPHRRRAWYSQQRKLAELR
jgi:glycosyltransferase involved in cell wall biosynthesis